MGIDRKRTGIANSSATWDEIIAAVEFLAEKSKADMPANEFHSLVLEKLLAATACDDGKIWTKCESWCHNSPSTRSLPDHEDWKLSASVSRDTLEADSDLGGDVNAATLEEVCSGNETHGYNQNGHCIWRLPVRVDSVPVAVIQLVGGERSTSERRQGIEQLLSVVGDLIADHARAEQFRLLKAREHYRGELDRFIAKIHHSLQIDQVAYFIVNLGRSIIGGDRVTLLLADNKKMRAVAVSGIDTLDRRSQSIVEIERQAFDFRTASQSVWMDHSSASHATPQQNALHASSTEPTTAPTPTAAPTPTIVCHSPLKLKATDGKSIDQTIGMLRIDWYDDLDKMQRSISETRVDWVTQHASRAIANAITANSRRCFGIYSPAVHSVGRSRRVTTLIALLVATAISTALIFLEADLKIEARGSLQPVTREVIFAPRAATVTDFPILQKSSDPLDIEVHPGDVVILLESAELQYELTTLVGEQATITQQLDTLSVTLSQLAQVGIGSVGNRERFDELTAQSLELRVRSESLAERIGLLQKEQQKLSLKSSIRGRIVTWDFTRKLRGRPVSQGDRLLEIVDTEGQWQLELFVPDHHFGYVSWAVSDRQNPVAISFIERSNPTVKHSGEVLTVGRSTEVVAQHGASVRLIGSVDKHQLSDSIRPGSIRVGTTVIAEIDCGKRSLGFVWLHDLWEAIRMKILF